MKLGEAEKQRYNTLNKKARWLNAKTRQMVCTSASDKPGYMRHCQSCPVWDPKQASSVPVHRLAAYWYDRWLANGNCKDNHVGNSGRRRAVTLTEGEQQQCAKVLAQPSAQRRSLKDWARDTVLKGIMDKYKISARSLQRQLSTQPKSLSKCVVFEWKFEHTEEQLPAITHCVTLTQ
jgi:hypothetical protein